MRMSMVVESLEKDLELLCLTGVEDKLQENVRPTLELLRNAGIKVCWTVYRDLYSRRSRQVSVGWLTGVAMFEWQVWMLTGDKLETATCIAKSARLVSRTQSIYTFKTVRNRAEALAELNAFRRRTDVALIITGSSLEVWLLDIHLRTWGG